jgi:spoIIIJ-associated protein
VTELEASGATVDEAVTNGLSELAATRDQVEVEVLSDADPARVRLVLREESQEPEAVATPDEASGLEDAVPPGEEPDGALTQGSGLREIRPQGDESAAEPSDPQEVLEFAREDALDFLEGVLDAMDLDGEVRVEVIEDSLQATVDGQDLGVLIGRHGRTLDALQELLRAAVQHQGGTRIRMNLDIEGYRERRREQVAEMAREIAEQALEDGEARLEPMIAFERKVVHDTVAEIEGVSSQSEGEEPDRYVVVRRDSE